MRRVLYVVAALAALTGCASHQPYADDATVAAVSYRDSGPASITLLTMVNNRTGQGAHSSLLINASERILFDPAGSFYASTVPEQNDVLFGITPQIEQYYISAHARSTHHVVRQTIEVSPSQAETAYRLARGYGAVPGAFCTNATSGVLQQVPGFAFINTTLFPNNLMEQVAKIPGVESETFFEDDDGDLQARLAQGI